MGDPGKTTRVNALAHAIRDFAERPRPLSLGRTTGSRRQPDPMHLSAMTIPATRSPFPLRHLVPVAAGALLAVAACRSADGRLSVCGVSPSITAPQATRGDLAPVLRFHGTVTPDSAWREKLVQALATAPADSLVRVLFVHGTAVTTDDRTRVQSAGGTIVEEDADVNGIVASFTVAAVRAYAPTAPLDRVIDGHLVTVRVLPPCD